MAIPIAQTVWEASPNESRTPIPPGEEAPAVDFVLLDVASATDGACVRQISNWVEAQIISLVDVAEVQATAHLCWTVFGMSNCAVTHCSSHLASN